MSSNKAQEDKNMKIVRQLSTEPDNKKCMDCGVKGTVYVCSNFNTFICTACSGLHREFSHRVKSISMTIFKPEEVKALQAGGNAVARRKWLARWTPEDFPEPDPSDSPRVKAFMKLKYIDKRWYSETGEGPQQYASHHAPPSKPQTQTAAPKSDYGYPQPEPLTKILGNDIPPIHVNGSHKQPAVAAPPAHPPVAQGSQSSLVDWNSKPAAPSKVSSDLDDLLSIPNNAQTQAYQQQLHHQQQQNLYQQQQQLVMSQFGQAQPGGWGAPPPAAVPPGFFSPYGPTAGFQPQQQPGFFGGVQTPPNFFAPPTGQPAQSMQPLQPTGGFGQPQHNGGFGQPQHNGAPSPTFGQPPASHPYGAPPRATPSPTPQNQISFGSTLSPAPNPAYSSPSFGGPALSPAQAQFSSPSQPAAPAFNGLSPALHSTPGGFGQPQQSPSLTSSPFGAQPAPAAQPPAADKYDVFAALSPLAGGGSKSASVTKPATASHTPAPTSSAPHGNPNPFGDPFGGLQAQPAHPPAQQTQTQSHGGGDPFGFGGAVSPSLKPQSQPASSDPFGFGPTASQPHQSQPQQQQFQQQQQQQNANPFGANPFGQQQQQQQQQQSPQQSAFSPFGQQQPNANPFGQNQQQPVQADPWGGNNANPFF